MRHRCVVWLVVTLLLLQPVCGPATCRAVPAASIQGGFPFTISGSQFLRNGVPVFLNVIGYQPLEPDEDRFGEIRLPRVMDDLRRLRAYRGGSDPLLLRVYAQPTLQFPNRMPKEFYDGVRDLNSWVIRNVYFTSSSTTPQSLADGRAKIDAVIAEVESAGALDRIFAWQFGNEFQALGSPANIETFICAMRDHLKSEMAKPGRQGFSNWVTWASWVQSDAVFTSGNNPILPNCLDFVSYNAYGYEPDRLRDQQAGPILPARARSDRRHRDSVGSPC